MGGGRGKEEEGVGVGPRRWECVKQRERVEERRYGESVDGG
jgi:hypothetical protein